MNTIIIPNNNVEERSYILNYFFRYIYNVDFVLEKDSEINSTEIILEGCKPIIIEDFFFNQFENTLEYLVEKNVPNQINWFFDENYFDEKVPVLFGGMSIIENEQNIVCKIDIIASSFFMLTRWEEYVIPKRDKNDRFDEEESLAIKHNFFQIPIVNQYIEILWNLLLIAGYNKNKPTREYNLIITHDVDQIYRYDSVIKIAKAMAGDIIVRKNPLLIFSTFYRGLKSFFNKKYDPYNTFDFLMQCSNKLGVKSRFYFIPSYEGEYDARYSIDNKKVKNIIDNIVANNHSVGIHGSWNGFDNEQVFINEFLRLNKIINIEEGRQHYLRFKNPLTWKLWNNVGLKRDSTIGYYGKNGFRAGICYEYPTFDIIDRKQLELVEYPLVFMEIALGTKKKKNDYINELSKLSKTVKKYDGNMVFLWHPNNLFENEWKALGKHYEEYLCVMKL